MKLINQLSLGRGRVLMDYAFSGDDLASSLEPADYVGLVAAYIAREQPTKKMREELSERLGPQISDAAVRTFETFNDPHGRGLWTQGPAMDDIMFSNAKLKACYPAVDERWKTVADATRNAEDSERQF